MAPIDGPIWLISEICTLLTFNRNISKFQPSKANGLGGVHGISHARPAILYKYRFRSFSRLRGDSVCVCFNEALRCFGQNKIERQSQWHHQKMVTVTSSERQSERFASMTLHKFGLEIKALGSHASQWKLTGTLLRAQMITFKRNLAKFPCNSWDLRCCILGLFTRWAKMLEGGQL